MRYGLRKSQRLLTFKSLVFQHNQKELCKMLSRSKPQIFFGFKDGPKAVKYYNMETRKVLTSWNYHFLSLQKGTPPEEIVVTPDMLCQGELRGSAQPLE